MLLQRERSQVQPGDPAFCALPQACHILGAERQSHLVTEEVGGLLPCEAELGCPKLDQLPSGAQLRKGKRRIFARDDHEMEVSVTVTTHEPLALAVTEPSQVGEVRRAASGLAGRLGFDETRRGELAIVLTELANTRFVVKDDGTGGYVDA